MTTTARISSTTSTGEYEFAVASGQARRFVANGLSHGEVMECRSKDGAGNFTIPINFVEGGIKRSHALTIDNNSASIPGPIDAKWFKAATDQAAELLEYS